MPAAPVRPRRRTLTRFPQVTANVKRPSRPGLAPQTVAEPAHARRGPGTPQRSDGSAADASWAPSWARPPAARWRSACWSTRARAGGCRARARACAPSAATDTLVGHVERVLAGDRALPPALRRRRRLRARPRAAAQVVLTSDLERVIGLEGCLVGQRARRARRRAAAATGRARGSAGRSRSRSSSARARSSTSRSARSPTSSPRRPRPTATQAKQARQRGPQAGARPRATRRARPRSSASRPSSSRRPRRCADTLQLALKYGLTSGAAAQRPGLRLAARLRRAASRRGRRRRASPTCSRRKDSALDPGAAAARAQRRAARRARSGSSARVAMPDWRLANGGTYVVTGAPVVARRPDRRDITDSIVVLLVAALLVMALDAGARLPRRGCGCCRWSSRWRAAALTFGGLALIGASLTMASIGVAAGADRAGGRLRDPAAVAHQERAGPGRARRGRARGRTARARRADGRDRGAGDRGGLPRARALAGADGPRVRAAAGRGHRRRAGAAR